MQNSTVQLLSTCVVVLIYVGFKQGLEIQIPSGSILPVLWLGIVDTGFGCFLYFSSISALRAQTVAICGYLEPLSAVLFSTIILRESMLPLQILGASLILGGTLVMNMHRRAERAPE